MRAIPGLIVLRPADANEVTEAWRVIMQLRDQPACLVLTRQALPTLDRTKYASRRRASRGAPMCWPTRRDGEPEVILIGTGSEVSLCIDAHEQLDGRRHRLRVVSMPSWELFEQQDQAYRDRVLPPADHARG